MVKKNARARAPLRLGLAGGGTDVSPYCDVYGGLVLNSTIDRYAWTSISCLDGNEVVFSSTDLGQQCIVNVGNLNGISKPLILHKAVYREVMHRFNGGVYLPLSITTNCEAPMGSGLGASSTIVVSMLKAYDELLNLALDDYELARLAVYIERKVCGLQGGKQDQYAAAFGGFNFIEFGAGGEVLVNSLRIKNWVINELEAAILLCFTGVSRESGNIIKDQSQNLSGNNEQALEAMHRLKNDALVMKKSLLEGDLGKLIDCVNQSWINKTQTSSRVSNRDIDNIMTLAFRLGALAGKVSGAGGGGFIWFIVEPEKKVSISNALEQLGCVVANCRFTKKGAESWTLK